MARSRTYTSKKDLLNELAPAHAGYFTAHEANEVGLSSPYLNHYRKTGQILPAFRGVYRLATYPPGENEELIVVWLASDQKAVFSHETALQLHRLSDLLPRRIHISLPPSSRRKLPDGVERHNIVEPITERQWIGDVPVTSVLRTLHDCRQAHVSPEFVLQAIERARARGLIDPADAKGLVDSYVTTKI